jgi:diguanylate cyclase (GGDEF)-like protein
MGVQWPGMARPPAYPEATGCLPRWPLLRALLCLFAVLAAATDAVASLAPDPGTEDVAHTVSYRVDPGRSLEIAQVASSPEEMSPLDRTELRAGYSRSAYWFRILPSDRDRLLEVGSPFLDHVDLYLPRAGGGYTVVRSGDARPFAEREIIHRHPLFSLPAGLAGPAYLHVHSEGLINIPLRLWRPEAFASHVAYEQFGFGVYYGIMLVMVLYNLSLYLFVKDRNYLYYVLYIGSYILFQAAFNGFAPMFLWPEWPWWAGHAPGFFIGAVVLGAVTFSRHFLDAAHHVPGLDRAMRGLQVLAVAAMVLVLVGPYSSAARFANYLGLALVLVVLPAGLLCLRRGYRPARWFVIAWTAFLLGVFTSGLDIAGHLPHSPHWIYAMQIGSATEVVLLSIALAHRIATLRQEKDEARAQADLNLYRLNNELEALVQRRTVELEQAKEQAEALSFQLAAKNTALQQVASHDGLTGTFNRAAFTELMAQRIAEALRHDTPCALLMVDLDYFKAINDCFGHQVGDRVLQVAAAALDRGKRSGDLLGRYGGEEFVLFLSHADCDSALPIAERLRRAIAEITLNDFPGLRLSASLGVAWPGRHECEDLAETLIRRADQALYLAKHLGRNRVCTQLDVSRRLEQETVV